MKNIILFLFIGLFFLSTGQAQIFDSQTLPSNNISIGSDNTTRKEICSNGGLLCVAFDISNGKIEHSSDSGVTWNSLGSSTLQEGYNSSANGKIELGSTQGSLKITDNDSASIESPLFQVLGNIATSAKKYFEVGLDYILNPVRSTADRPSGASQGMQGFNSDEECLEVYNGSEWECVGSGGGGSSGINFIVDGSFEKEELDLDVNIGTTKSYETYSTDDQLASEFNEKYWQATGNIPFISGFPVTLRVSDTYARTGMDDRTGFFSAWVNIISEDDYPLTLCVTVDDATHSGECSDELKVELIGDGKWRKVEMPFTFGASSVDFRIFSEIYVGDYTVRVDQVYVGTTPESLLPIQDCAEGQHLVRNGTNAPAWSCSSAIQGKFSQVSDEVSYTPANTQGFGTISNNNLKWMRVGSNLILSGTFNGGTVTGSEAQIELPNGYQVSSSVTSLRACGVYFRNVSSGSGDSGGSVLITAGDTHVNFSKTSVFSNSTGVAPLNPAIASDVYVTGEKISIVNCNIPIEGWTNGLDAVVANNLSANDAGFISWSSNDQQNVIGHSPADGSCHLKTDYPDYMKRVGIKYGECTVTVADDGFNVIDLRGQFPRVLDDMGTVAGAAGVDIDGTARTVGQTQNDEIGSHRHKQTQRTSASGGSNMFTTDASSSGATPDGNFTQYTGGTETRPTNVALMAYVRLVDNNVIAATLQGINSTDSLSGRYYLSNSQTLSGATQATVKYNTRASGDDGGNLGASFNATTGVFTSPIDSCYTASASAVIGGVASGKRPYIAIAKEDTAVVYSGDVQGATETALLNVSINKICLSTGETLEAFVSSGDTSNRSITAGEATHFAIQEIPDTKAIVKNLNDNPRLRNDQYSESEIKWGLWNGEQLYRRCFTVASDITTNNAVIVSWDSNLKPKNMTLYSTANAWIFQGSYIASTADRGAIAYNDSNGQIFALVNGGGRVVGAGTSHCMDYTK